MQCVHTKQDIDPERQFSYSNLSIFSPSDTLAAPALLRRVFPPLLDIVALEEALHGVVFLCEDLTGCHTVDNRVTWSASAGVREHEEGGGHTCLFVKQKSIKFR